MNRKAASSLGKDLAFLQELRRRGLDERRKAAYIGRMAEFVDTNIWRPLRVKGPIHIYGKLYFDRRRHGFTRQIRKNVFEPISALKVANGYRLMDIEGGLLHALENHEKQGSTR
jgi:hypothetical protein